MNRLQIILLYDSAAMLTGTIRDHVNAFETMSRHQVHAIDANGAADERARLDLADVLVLHYSLVISSTRYIKPEFAKTITAFSGPKILFIQDEYRWVDRTSDAARNLGVSVIYTVVNEEVVRKIYRAPWFNNVRFEQTLTGYVPEALCARVVPSYQDRPIDVSYRARSLPGWLGDFAQEKQRIGVRFARDAQHYGLNCDIETSEGARIYGDDWIRFVANSKAVLGSESGASFIDFSGEVQKQVEAFERAHPDTPFEEVQRRFLEGRDRDIVINVISPRCFEAAALRTLLVLYPGTYSNVLEPNRHYVPLARDHSNMGEVVDYIRDPNRAGPIIDRAFQEVASAPRWTFSSFIKGFDQVAEDEHARSGKAPAGRETADYLLNLRSRAARRARPRNFKLRLANQVLKATFAAERGLLKALPLPVAKPLIEAGRAVGGGIKPLVRRLLVGSP